MVTIARIGLEINSSSVLGEKKMSHCRSRVIYGVEFSIFKPRSSSKKDLLLRPKTVQY